MSNIYDLADIWNDGATTFTSIKVDVTNTASAAGSNLMDLKIGGVSKFRVDKAGSGYLETAAGDGIYFNNFGTGTIPNFISFMQGGSRKAYIIASLLGQLDLGSTGSASNSMRFNSADYFIFRQSNAGVAALAVDANDTFAIRQGVASCAQNIYNTYTNASNYERARMGWTANAYEIKPEAAGTGTVRVLHISGLPTSDPGTGILWNDAGTVKVGA
jgi:hypothetical protein